MDVRLWGHVEADLPPMDIDARQIARVLANLLQNAVRHTPAGGATLVCARRKLRRHAAEVGALLNLGG